MLLPAINAEGRGLVCSGSGPMARASSSVNSMGAAAARAAAPRQSRGTSKVVRGAMVRTGHLPATTLLI